MVHSFKVACEKDNLKQVRSFVETTLNEYPVSDIDKNMMILAVDEVCANLIIHNHKCNPEDFIILNIKFINGSMMFEIIDEGDSFNMLNYEESSLKQIIKDKKKGGLGIMLVKRIMDNIELSSDNSHNVCRLYKRISI